MQIPKAWNWEHLSNKLSLLKMLLEPKTLQISGLL